MKVRITKKSENSKRLFHKYQEEYDFYCICKELGIKPTIKSAKEFLQSKTKYKIEVCNSVE